MNKDNLQNELEQILGTCHSIFRLLCELPSEPPAPPELIASLSKKREAFAGALRFHSGENVSFDVSIVREIATQFIEKNYKGEAQIQLKRALWHLLEKRLVLPLPKTPRPKSRYTISVYRTIEAHVRNGEKLVDVCKSLDPKSPENLKSAFYSYYEKTHGKRFSVKKVQGK